MKIKLTQDVSTSYTKTAKGGYSTAEINYEGAKFPFKMVSFSNPATFEILKDAKVGQEFEVESVKEGQYFQWKSAKLLEGSNEPLQAVKGTTAYQPTRSTYETPEERAVKQRLIVRQSSLSNAIEVLTTGAKAPPNLADIAALADSFVEYVYEKTDLFDEPNDLMGA